VTRVGGATDFDSGDARSSGSTLALGFSTGFDYALVAGHRLGISFEPGVDLMGGVTDGALWGWKSPVPWEDRSYASGWAALHVATRLEPQPQLGLDVRWTPFVFADGGYDDIDQLRVGMHVDIGRVTLRGDFAHGTVKGEDRVRMDVNDPRTGTLDGHESIISLGIALHFH
jgi:hypothetical protein